MTNKKILRVAEQLRRELGFILDQKLGDRRVGMVTITRVELSDDMKYAKIYVSFLGDEDRSQSLKRLKHARRFLRAELATCMDVRVVPELTFMIDDSSENYIKIAEVLKKIHEQDDQRLSAEETESDGEAVDDGPDDRDAAGGDESGNTGENTADGDESGEPADGRR